MCRRILGDLDSFRGWDTMLICINLALLDDCVFYKNKARSVIRNF